MADEMAERLREAAGTGERARRQDPRALIRDMAENSPSESVRLQAARALHDMNAEDRARREAAKEGSNPYAELSDQALNELVDANLAGDLRALLNPHTKLYPREDFPEAHRVIDFHLEREVEARVEAALAKAA